MEVIGRVESGTETESNAGAVTEDARAESNAGAVTEDARAKSNAGAITEQISSSYRGRLHGCRRLKITRTNFPAVAEERMLFRNTSDREKNL